MRTRIPQINVCGPRNEPQWSIWRPSGSFCYDEKIHIALTYCVHLSMWQFCNCQVLNLKVSLEKVCFSKHITDLNKVIGLLREKPKTVFANC